MQPNIEIDELKKYAMENPSYRLYVNGDRFELHFTPNTPEAESHFPNGESVEHIMYGIIKDNVAYFEEFVTVSAFGETKTIIRDDDPIMEWLKYI
ncbi:MAG: hypothetical protein QXZ44_03635 [Ferroplasma sp.]